MKKQLSDTGFDTRSRTGILETGGAAESSVFRSEVHSLPSQSFIHLSEGHTSPLVKEGIIDQHENIGWLVQRTDNAEPFSEIPVADLAEKYPTLSTEQQAVVWHMLLIETKAPISIKDIVDNIGIASQRDPRMVETLTKLLYNRVHNMGAVRDFVRALTKKNKLPSVFHPGNANFMATVDRIATTAREFAPHKEKLLPQFQSFAARQRLPLQ